MTDAKLLDPPLLLRPDDRNSLEIKITFKEDEVNNGNDKNNYAAEPLKPLQNFANPPPLLLHPQQPRSYIKHSKKKTTKGDRNKYEKLI